MLEQRWICPNWDIFHFKSQYFSLHIYRSLKIGLLVLIWKQDPPKYQNMLIALNDGSSSLPTWLQGELPRRSSPVCLKVLPGNFTWGRRPVLNTGGAISYDRVTDWTKRAQQTGHKHLPLSASWRRAQCDLLPKRPLPWCAVSFKPWAKANPSFLSCLWKGADPSPQNKQQVSGHLSPRSAHVSIRGDLRMAFKWKDIYTCWATWSVKEQEEPAIGS